MFVGSYRHATSLIGSQYWTPKRCILDWLSCWMPIRVAPDLNHSQPRTGCCKDSFEAIVGAAVMGKLEHINVAQL